MAFFTGKNPIHRLLLGLLIVFACQLARADTQPQPDPDQVRQALDNINGQIDSRGLRAEGVLDNALREVRSVRSGLIPCVTDKERELNTLRDSIGAEYIQEIQGKETRSEEENKLFDQISTLTSTINTCKVLMEQAVSLQDRLVAQQLALHREDLRQRNDHVVNNLAKGLPGLTDEIKKRIANVTRGSVAERGGLRLASILILALAGLLAGLFINRKRIHTTRISGQPPSFRILFATWHFIRNWLPLLIPISAVSLYLLLAERELFLSYPLNRVILLCVAYILTLLFGRALIRWYSKYAKQEMDARIPVVRVYIRLVIAVTTTLLWLILVVIAKPSNIDQPASQLLHNILTSALLISHLELVLYIKHFVPMSRLVSLLRVIVVAVFGIALPLELLGFMNLANFIWVGTLASLCSIFAFYFISRLFSDFYDTLESGRYTWQQRLRAKLSVHTDDPIPGLVWIRLLTISVLWVGFGLLLLKSWDFPNARIASLFAFLRDGIAIGDTQIILSNVLLGILLFSVLLLLIGWGKESLDKKYLVRSKMGSGARDAIVTIFGYVGFVIAVLIGLSVAGAKISNLALVAGALSVGIGFGLQNIVNNFVSGIILLFERPIQTGDWIVTGQTEGIVRRISVRSTEIQTFDRSEVIVPNSDLISGIVTNWTLRDKFGRIIITVGVAYGSDTERVRQVLEEIPRDLASIVKDHPLMPIKVLFRGFGDSTLDFELRCFIYDINGVLDIKSELHFAIDKAFRENNIEIAFPQRDLHIRSGLENLAGNSRDPENYEGPVDAEGNPVDPDS